MITEADLAKLTHRQREMLSAFAQQLSSDEVARLLHIAEATLKIDMTSFRVRFHHWPLPLADAIIDQIVP
ncbi:MAG: LuxR C-terminal-related transcriptional regulator [Rhodoplanes sp.]